MHAHARAAVVSACLLQLLARVGAQTTAWGACDADPAYSDPEPDVAALQPRFAAPPPPNTTVPSPRMPLVPYSLQNERVLIPVQAAPTDAQLAQRTGCPHLAPGLRRWHDPATWPNGSLPVAGGDVLLPTNASVLLSSCSVAPGTVFGTITIPAGSALVFADANISLAAHSILVQGALRVGSATCRTLSSVNITLHGSRPAGVNNLTNSKIDTGGLPAGAKAILASGRGAVDLHGAQYAVTWSRLAARAVQNDTWVFIQDRVNWEPGQSVLVTTTALKDARDYSESETRTIRRLFALPAFGNVTAIELSAPLNFSHACTASYQGEVALLSRRVVVQGALADSLPTDPQPANFSCGDAWFTSVPCANYSLTGYGAMTMIMGPQAAGRFSGVLFLRGGKTNVMGHYPLHWHMVGNGTVSTAGGVLTEVSFAQDCSIWQSFFRAISVHATDRLRISNVVAHDITGHAMYLEDGVEERNTFEFNLVSLVHPIGNIPREGMSSGQYFPDWRVDPWLLVPADIAAGAFYGSNPFNTWVGNVAVGGWSGFIFPDIATPTGLSRGSSVVPRNRPTLVFEGNTAHSSGYFWGQAGCIYVGGSLFYANASTPDPTYNPGRVAGRSGPMVFNNTKTFLCNVGLMHWGSVLDVRGYETHDVQRAATVFGSVGIDGMLMNCRTENVPGAPGRRGFERSFYTYGTTAFEWYDVGQSHILTNITLRNCSRLSPGARGFTMKTHSDQFIPDAMMASSRVTYENMALASSPNSRLRIGMTVNGTTPTMSLLLANWYDVDGSATGTGRPTIIGSLRSGRWWEYDRNCTARTDWVSYLCDWTPNRAVASAFFNFDRAAQTQGVGAVGDAYCSNGNTAIPCPIIGSVTHVGHHGPRDGMPFSANTKITGPAGGFGWFMQWTNGTPPVLNISSIQMRPVDSVTLILPYPPGTRFNVSARISSSTCPSSCTVARQCLCRWVFREVASPEEVRSGRGDTWHFTGSHLYLRLTPQSSSNIGVNGTWGIPALRGFSRQGIELPPRTSHVLSVVADCPTRDPTGRYCAPLPSPLAVPTTPCVSGVQTGIDSCASPSATATVTASGTQTPSSTLTPPSTGTPSRSATPSVSATGTASLSAAPTGSPTGSVSATGSPTPSHSVAPTASGSATGSLSASRTSSVSASATGSLSASRTGSVSASATGSLSASGTGSLSASGTGSLTAAATATPSASATPPGTASRTGSHSPAASVSAAGTAAATGTGTPSVAPSRSGTASPAGSTSRTPVPSTTSSLSPSGRAAAPGTPSATGTRTRTRSSGGATRSRSVSATPTRSRSVSASGTRSRQATPTRTRKAKVLR